MGTCFNNILIPLSHAVKVFVELPKRYNALRLVREVKKHILFYLWRISWLCVFR